MSEIERVVVAFIVENFLFGASEDAPSSEDSFMETGLIDSTGILELIGFVEDKYEIEVEDEELVPENLDSVRNIAQFITRKQGK